MRLRRSDPDGDGFRRVRRGRGFSYHNSSGGAVTDEAALTRFAELVIPPAWRRVWICPDENGHLQAVGIDDAGRRQYLYHPQWRRARTEEKHDRVRVLARRLPEFRAAVDADLALSGTGRERVLAGGLREVQLRDPQLAALVRTLRRSRTGTDRLLAYRRDGAWHEVRAEEVNERFKELTGDEYTAKDLRTWNATVLAAAAFAAHDLPRSQRGRQRVRAAVMREVAEELGNTPAVALASYVDPRVVRRFEQDRTIRAAVRRAAAQQFDEDETRAVLERAVVRLLS